MDLQERRQLDVAARMTKVRAKARPWRSIIALILAIAGAVLTAVPPVTGVRWLETHQGHSMQKLVWICGLVAFVAFGMMAVIGLSARARRTLQPLVGQAHAGIIRYVLLLAGVFAMLTITLYIVGVKPDKLLVGGAVTGVLLGIAAQQSLANLFAGLVLLFASPFRVGDHIRLRAGALGGELDGVVTDLSLAYVRLQTDQGSILIPNSQALAAAVMLIPAEQPAATALAGPAAAAANTASQAGPSPDGSGSAAGESAA